MYFFKERLDRSGVADHSQEGTAKLQRVLWVSLAGFCKYGGCLLGLLCQSYAVD